MGGCWVGFAGVTLGVPLWGWSLLSRPRGSVGSAGWVGCPGSSPIAPLLVARFWLSAFMCVCALLRVWVGMVLVRDACEVRLCDPCDPCVPFVPCVSRLLPVSFLVSS